MMSVRRLIQIGMTVFLLVVLILTIVRKEQMSDLRLTGDVPGGGDVGDAGSASSIWQAQYCCVNFCLADGPASDGCNQLGGSECQVFHTQPQQDTICRQTYCNDWFFWTSEAVENFQACDAFCSNFPKGESCFGSPIGGNIGTTGGSSDSSTPSSVASSSNGSSTASSVNSSTNSSANSSGQSSDGSSASSSSAASSVSSASSDSSSESSSSSDTSQSSSSSTESSASSSESACIPPYWNVCDPGSGGTPTEYRFTTTDEVKTFLQTHTSATVGGCPQDTNTRWGWSACVNGVTQISNNGNQSDMFYNTAEVKAWLSQGGTLGPCSASVCDWAPHCSSGEYEHHQSGLLEIPYAEGPSGSTLPAEFDGNSATIYPQGPVDLYVSSTKTVRFQTTDYKKVFLMGYAPEDEEPDKHLTDNRLEVRAFNTQLTQTLSYGGCPPSPSETPVEITSIVQQSSKSMDPSIDVHFFDDCGPNRSHTRYYITLLACVNPGSSSSSLPSSSSSSPSSHSSSRSSSSSAVSSSARSSSLSSSTSFVSSAVSSFITSASSSLTSNSSAVSSRASSTTLVALTSVCGNTFRETGEDCDDGNTDNTDQCTNSCRRARCGDGIQQIPEQCDQGVYNADDVADTCRTTCVLPRCGDRIIDTNEDCDDGNRTNTDSCPNDCRMVTSCGNGIGESGEVCDDGNTDDDDGCTSFCLLSDDSPCEDQDQCGGGLCQSGRCATPIVCGDGIVQKGEFCDQGDDNSNIIPNRCRANCLLASLGDGVIDNGEECDDGNMIDGDGCDRDGQSELIAGATDIQNAFVGNTSSASAFTQTLPAALLSPPLAASFIGGVLDQQHGGAPLHNPETGPAAVILMASGAAGGLAWIRRRRR